MGDHILKSNSIYCGIIIIIMKPQHCNVDCKRVMVSVAWYNSKYQGKSSHLISNN